MNKNKKFDYRKVMVTFTPEQEKFLNDFCSEVKSQKGASLSRTEIIRALVDFLATLNVDLHGIRDEKELLERIKSAVK